MLSRDRKFGGVFIRFVRRFTDISSLGETTSHRGLQNYVSIDRLEIIQSSLKTVLLLTLLVIFMALYMTFVSDKEKKHSDIT
jgi:hypothetical protein